MDKFEGNLGELLQSSLKINKAGVKLAADSEVDDILTAGGSDCINFNFDIKILSIEGSICKSGRLEIKGSVIGIPIGHTVVDLSKGAFCAHPSIGIEEVKYCFYISGSCLRTKGYVDGWFHKKQSWDEQILCF